MREDIRRTYVLAPDLIERIGAFQADRNLPSETEAVRRALDIGLSYYETPEQIEARVRRILDLGGDLTDAARAVLVGHPAVRTIAMDGRGLTFTVEGGREIRIGGGEGRSG